MAKNNRTHLSRAARKLQAASDLTYQQALNRLRRADQIPDLDDPAAVAAFLAATTPTPAPGTCPKRTVGHLWTTPVGSIWGGDPHKSPVALTCALCGATIEATPPTPVSQLRVRYEAYEIDHGDIFLFQLVNRGLLDEQTYRNDLWAKHGEIDVPADRIVEVVSLPEELELLVDVDVIAIGGDELVWADDDGDFVLADGSTGNPGCDTCGVEDAVVRYGGRYLCDLHAGDNGIHRHTATGDGTTLWFIESGTGERVSHYIANESDARWAGFHARQRLIRVTFEDGQAHTHLELDYAAADPDGIGAWQCDECGNWINAADPNIGNHTTRCSQHPANQAGYCAQCLAPGHDTCSMTAGCPCCERTIDQANEDGAALVARLRAKRTQTPPPAREILHCSECGEEMFLTDTGVAHHVDDDNPDGIDYDADADHVAIDDGERDCGRCGQSFNLAEGGDEWVAEVGGPRCLRCETGEGPIYCRFCHKEAGRDYHIAGAVPADENPIVCDNCWDERLR